MSNNASGKPRPTFRVKSRSVHRIVATLIVAFTLYFAATGVTIQIIDLRTLARNAPATDPDMMAIRESLDGPGNFAVIKPADYAATSFPDGYDFSSALRQVMVGVHRNLGASAALRFVEFRMLDQGPSGLVLTGDRVLRFDPTNGDMRSAPSITPSNGPPTSTRNAVKNLHRLHVFGDGVLWLNALVGISLFAMVVTGMIMYFQLFRALARVKRPKVFWFVGGWWRSLHRWVAIIAALFLTIVSMSGTLLSIDSLSLFIYRMVEPPEKLFRGLFPLGMTQDESSPLDDSRLADMLNQTLAAYRGTQGTTPVKVVRLRSFAGMPQGVVIGGRDDTRQWVFNAVTGQRMSMTEPGYPYTGFPFGWEEHELMKRIHRGDIFGIPGRLMDLFAGLSLIFLSLSGFVMYIDLRSIRGRTGRKQMFWT